MDEILSLIETESIKNLKTLVILQETQINSWKLLYMNAKSDLESIKNKYNQLLNQIESNTEIKSGIDLSKINEI